MGGFSIALNVRKVYYAIRSILIRDDLVFQEKMGSIFHALDDLGVDHCIIRVSI